MAASALLANAVDSLRIGVEDFLSADPGRALSSVRNMSAGVLLLMKEKLRQMSPAGTDEVLLKQKLRARLSGGNLDFVGTGKKTVDARQIEERLRDLGVSADWGKVHRIVDIRNEVEHYYSTESPQRLRELVSDVFVVVRDFAVRHLNIEPRELLGAQTWQTILQTAEVFNQELADCAAARAALDWPAPAIEQIAERLRCVACDSPLLKPVSTSGSPWHETDFRCSPCGRTEPFAEMAELAVENWSDVADTHRLIKDGGELPYEECPECQRTTYLVAESMCAACGYEAEFLECAVCGSSLSVEEQDFGGLCSYHRYVAEREADR